MTIWFTSDTHFGHANIIGYCGRPFADVEEMNRTMIERWNARVGAEDIVYHLGDFAFGPATMVTEFLSRLRGRIHLVRGNHDRSTRRMEQLGFNSAQEFVSLDLDGQLLLLTHKPVRMKMSVVMDYPPFELNLHGHVHEKWARHDERINVGVDVRDFEPKTLEELLR